MALGDPLKALFRNRTIVRSSYARYWRLVSHDGNNHVTLCVVRRLVVNACARLACFHDSSWSSMAFDATFMQYG